jgi:hypothetical protein
MPVFLILGIFSLLCSLFVSVSSYDLEKAFLFYQTPKLWVFLSLVRDPLRLLSFLINISFRFALELVLVVPFIVLSVQLLRLDTIVRVR